MYITMHLNDKPYNKIKNGTKTIEMRLFDGKRKYLTVGDTIKFINKTNEDETMEVEVLGVHIYPTFKELYQNFSKQELGYDEDEIANYLDMEEYYPLSEQEKNCVVGIEIKVKK